MRKAFILNSVVFICGMVVMSFEITGSRILGPYLGASAEVWAALISVILVSLSAGYWLGGRLADRRKSYRMFSVIILTAAMFFALANLIKKPVLAWLSASISDTRTGTLAGSLILFCLPSILLGMVSPYAVKLKLENVEKGGSTTGGLYALSTLGSIAGTFLTGFVFLAWFRITTIIWILTLSLVFAGTVILLIKNDIHRIHEK